MPRSRLLAAMVVALSPALLWACQETVVEVVDVATIELGGLPATVLPADEFELSATPRSDRNEALERDVSWASDDRSVATVSSSGVVTAISQGTARVTASADGTTVGIDVEVSDPCETPVGELAARVTERGQLRSPDCLEDGRFIELWSLRPQTDTFLQLDLTSTEFDTYMLLQDAQGRLLEIDDDGGSGVNSRSAGRFSSSRAHRILTTSSTTGATGAYDIAVSYLSGCPDLMRPIAPGGSVTGRLSAIDCEAGDGRLFDLRELELESTAAVTITLRSDAFDAFLTVLAPADADLDAIAADDDGGGGTDARLFQILDAGTYIIRTSSFAASEIGEYTLSVTTDAPAVRGNVAHEATNTSIVVGEEGNTDVVAVLTYGCYDPAWHPSGDWLVALCLEDAGVQEHEGGLTQIWRDRTEEVLVAGSGEFAEPAFSADGQWLFYRSSSGDRLLRATVDGESPETLLRLSDGRVRSPAPSPAGERVAYALETATDMTVAILDLASGQTSDLGIRAHSVAWSADGEWLALATPAGVTLVRPDGTEHRDFSTPYLDSVGEPDPPDNVDWAPDGRVIGDYDVPRDDSGHTFRRRLFGLDLQTGEWESLNVVSHPSSTSGVDTYDPTWSR